MDFGIEHILGPLGGFVILAIATRVLYTWLRDTMSKRIIALEGVIADLRKEVTALKTELDHCQSQHNITTQELLKLSNENGYLRGRLEAIDKGKGQS